MIRTSLVTIRFSVSSVAAAATDSSVASRIAGWAIAASRAPPESRPERTK